MAEIGPRYSNVSLTLHWLTAALVLAQPLLVWTHEATEGQPVSDQLMGVHFSIGVTILALTLIRLGWRLANRWIPLPATTPAWQKVAARANHVLFYALLIGMPIAGWVAFSAGGWGPIEWFGLFALPMLPMEQDRELAGAIMDLHKTAGWVLIALIVLHLIGALKHQFVDRDNVLRRMIPVIPPRP